LKESDQTKVWGKHVAVTGGGAILTLLNSVKVLLLPEFSHDN